MTGLSENHVFIIGKTSRWCPQEESAETLTGFIKLECYKVTTTMWSADNLFISTELTEFPVLTVTI